MLPLWTSVKECGLFWVQRSRSHTYGRVCVCRNQFIQHVKAPTQRFCFSQSFRMSICNFSSELELCRLASTSCKMWFLTEICQRATWADWHHRTRKRDFRWSHSDREKTVVAFTFSESPTKWMRSRNDCCAILRSRACAHLLTIDQMKFQRSKHHFFFLSLSFDLSTDNGISDNKKSTRTTFT